MYYNNIPDAPWIGMDADDWDERISALLNHEDPDEDFKYESWRDMQDEQKYNK